MMRYLFGVVLFCGSCFAGETPSTGVRVIDPLIILKTTDKPIPPEDANTPVVIQIIISRIEADATDTRTCVKVVDGKRVYEGQVPVLDKDGKPVLDKDGKPVLTEGKLVYVHDPLTVKQRQEHYLRIAERIISNSKEWLSKSNPDVAKEAELQVIRDKYIELEKAKPTVSP